MSVQAQSLEERSHYLPLHKVADLNPRYAGGLAPDALVSFVPMAGICAETATVVSDEERRFSEVAKGYTAFERGDVLVAKITPCFQNGKIAHARVAHQIGFGSTEFHVIRSHKKALDPQYVFHFLRQRKILAAGERRMTGSAGQRRVPENFLANLEILLPPLPEQRRIAEVLDRAEALRAKRRAALAQLDELTQSIFLEMFGDPVGNPKKWDDLQCLGDVAEVSSGITKGRKARAATRTVPYMAVLNVQDKALSLDTVKSIDATEAEIGRYRLQKDDLLLTEGGDADKLGRGTLWNNELPECIHQNHVFRVRLTSNALSPLFLNWLVGGPRGKNYFLRSAKQTTGIASINMTQLRGFPLLIPPRELQREFTHRVTAVEKLKAVHRQSLAEFDALFASLQDRAFRGEL